MYTDTKEIELEEEYNRRIQAKYDELCEDEGLILQEIYELARIACFDELDTTDPVSAGLISAFHESLGLKNMVRAQLQETVYNQVEYPSGDDL